MVEKPDDEFTNSQNQDTQSQSQQDIRRDLKSSQSVKNEPKSNMSDFEESIQNKDFRMNMKFLDSVY